MGEDGTPQYLLSVVEDLTERKRAEDRIRRLAQYDALTELPNRQSFSTHLTGTLDRAAKAKEAFAILSVDLDRFQDINDVFGHSVGDSLLRAMAQRLNAAGDGAYLARLGGDEFALIVEGNPKPADVERTAERLLAGVTEPFRVDEHVIRVGLSLGVAIYPTDGTDATSLLANAEAALHRAKSEGRGSIRFFEAGMDVRLRERRALVHDLRAAIERGELVLHYQPQAHIDGEIFGFEALVRWQHPQRGLVSPATFIPIAEESGLIPAIGEWVLREACREAATWPKPLSIAVNLSPAQFQHDDLPGFVHRVLLEEGLAANRLELEITESVLVDDLPRALAILRRLKLLGVRVAMDDFGTGYSSLSNLQSFPFDKIKIDRSFIANLHANPQSAAIVRAVIALGRGIGLPVIAEGVETREQLAFLAAEDCSAVQGYLVGRPLPADAYAQVVGKPAPAALAAAG
jgi:diguanylate cyclase (GGDEF)-like protein